MKTLFIPVRSKLNLEKHMISNLSKKLPKNIAIAYSIQFQDIALEIKKSLKKMHKITSTLQILGCNKPDFPKGTQAILLISNGKFHAISLAYETKLQVYLLDYNKLEKISKKEVEILEKKQKAAYVKFLNSKKIGIIISTKPGQQNIAKALEFEKKIKNKKSYLFIANNIDTTEFENFCLKSWVNTSCPRMDLNDSRIINLRDLIPI